MKFRDAFFVFMYLLKAKEWYIIAGSDNDHIKLAKIEFTKVLHQVNNDYDNVVVGEELLSEAKEILEAGK